MTIYCLVDPTTMCIRYVGKAIKPVNRLAVHICDAKRRRNPTSKWIRGLLKLGLRPILEVLEETDDADRDERFWIASLRAAGAQLTNVADGGDGVSGPMSAEAKLRMSASAKARWENPDKRAKLVAAAKRRAERDPDHIKKMVAASIPGLKARPRLGIKRSHPNSDEARKRQSEAAKKRVAKPAGRAQMDAARFNSYRRK